MTVIHPTFARRASWLGFSIALGTAGLFQGCGSSASTVGLSAGAGGSAGTTAGAGGKAAGGSSATGLCGGSVCLTDQVCCGPAECGTCIPSTSGRACPALCPGAAGGAGGSGGAGASSGAAGTQAGAGGLQGGSGGCAALGESCASRPCCTGLPCIGMCVMNPNQTGGAGGTGGNSSSVDCHLHDPSAFPSFDRSCSSPSDCSVVVHQIDCCGTRVVTGINTSELARFNTAEQACEAEFPACGCMGSPMTTDTGQITTTTAQPVECLTGTCTTYVP